MFRWWSIQQPSCIYLMHHKDTPLTIPTDFNPYTSLGLVKLVLLRHTPLTTTDRSYEIFWFRDIDWHKIINCRHNRRPYLLKTVIIVYIPQFAELPNQLLNDAMSVYGVVWGMMPKLLWYSLTKKRPYKELSLFYSNHKPLLIVLVN